MKANRLTRPTGKRWVMKPIKTYPEKIYPLRWLSPQEFERLNTKTIPTFLETARIYCLISCLTGLKYEEVGRLTGDHFCWNKAGHPAIRYTRPKTGKKMFIPVIPALQKIVDELTSDPSFIKRETLLPALGTAKRYANLQALAEICDIPLTLDSVLCRNTFSELLYGQGVPMKTITGILGMQIRHLDLSYRISEEDILKDVQKAFYISAKKPD